MNNASEAISNQQDTDFLKGGGEMGQLVRAKDWSKTMVGPVEQWPQSLKTAVNILLTSKFPMFIWWGENLVQFYNDGYRPSFGQEGKHPMALGQRGEDCWPEIWPIIKPQIDQVLTTGVPTWNENHLVPIYRNGMLEEVYWTYSYSPIYNDSGKVEGVLVVVNETTQNVISLRQIQLLRDIALASNQAKSVEEACQISVKALAKDPEDIPFALLYLLDKANSKKLRLIARTGLDHFPQAYSLSIDATDIKEQWPVWKVISSGQAIECECHALTGDAWPEPVRSAYIVPIKPANSREPVGVLVSGVNPRQKMNREYANFFDLIAGYIGSAICNAGLYEQERRRANELAEIDRARTELRIKEKVLLDNAEMERKRLYEVFMQAPAIVCIFRGPEHVYELVNPLYQKLLGSRKLTGRSIREALPELEGQGLFEILDNVYRTGEPFIGEEILIRLSRDEGSPPEDIFFNFIYASIKDENGRINGIYVFGYEVTAQVLAKQKLEQYNSDLSEKNEQLQRINNDLDNFVYTASHDLKAPISNLEGLLNALMDALNEEGRYSRNISEIMPLIGNSIVRFKNTILDLTEISKIQRNLEEDIVEVNIRTVIENVTIIIQDLITSSGAVIKIDTDGFSFIKFSEKNLQSIIYNLLSNAIKYRSPERAPLISIACKRQNEYMIIQVEDNGLGMAPSQIPQIFKMFKRVHDHVEGSGVGLYLVKRIVDNAGGKIEVESEVEKGSVFKIYLRV